MDQGPLGVRSLYLPRRLFAGLTAVEEDDDPSFQARFQGSKLYILLESCCLFICGGELYRIGLDQHRSTESTTSKPTLVQSYVRSGCSINGSTSNKALILTSEYSVLLFDYNAADSSQDFYEIQESFFSESEIGQLAEDALAIMFADFHRGLVIVVCQTRILILTVLEEPGNENGGKEVGEPAARVEVGLEFPTKDGKKLSVLGSAVIDIVWLFPSSPCTSAMPPEKHELEKAMQFAERSFVPVIEYCAVWGGEVGLTSIVCAGNGSWLQNYPIEYDSTTRLWRPTIFDTQDGQHPPEQWHLESDSAAVKKSHFPELVTLHTSWISAISKGSRATVYATGDTGGGILVWMIDEKAKLFVKAAYERNFCDSHRVTSICNDEYNNAFWIGDSAGFITYAFFNTTSRKGLEKLRAIKLFPNDCGINFLQWKQKLDTETEARGRLRALSTDTGVAVECFLHDSVMTLLSVPVEPAFEPCHRSIVEVCAVLPEFELVVTAGSGDKATIWDLKTHRVVGTIFCDDRFFTSICAFDSGFVPGGAARILTGHANGHTHDYVLSFHNPVPEQAATPNNDDDDATGAVIDAATGAVPDLKGGAESSTAALPPKTPADLAIFPKDEPAENTGHGIQWSDSMVVKVEHESLTEYLPLPVTQIVMSTLGLFYAFCYAQTYIVVHNWEEKRALAQIQFDQMLVEISCLSSTVDDEELEADTFIIVLQGQHNVKLFDALRGQILTSFDAAAGDQSPHVSSSALWDLPLHDGEGGRRILGVCASNGPTAFTFGDLTGFTPLNLFSQTSPDTVDGLVLGCRTFQPGHSPFASIWSMRSVHWLRVKLDNAVVEVLRVQQYKVPDDKVRILHATALRAAGRTHRLLVVLSDSTIFILTI